MSTPKPADHMADFMRQALGADPPWWAEAIAEHLHHPPEKIQVILDRRHFRPPSRRPLLLQDPTGRLVLAEALEPKP